jgi:hypothetical protein
MQNRERFIVAVVNNLNSNIGQTVQQLLWERIYKRHGDLICLLFRLKAGEDGKKDVKETDVEYKI